MAAASLCVRSDLTYLSGVLEADRTATDPADAAPAAAPSIAPASAEPDGFGVPKTPRGMAARWLASGATGTSPPTTDAKFGRSRCVHTTPHGATFLF